MNGIEPVRVECPYCGEPFTTTVDCSAGDQDYVEDCPVCCRPIDFSVALDATGRIGSLRLRRDDE